MKKIIYSLLVLLVLVSCGNDPAVDAAFARYGSEDGIISITAPGFLIRTAAAFADLEPAEEDLLDNIHKVKILAVDDHHKYRKINFYKEFHQLIDNDSYTELLSVKDSHNDVKILGKMNGDEEINNLIFMVGGNDNALIFIKGEFTLDQVASVINQYKEDTDFTSLARFK